MTKIVHVIDRFGAGGPARSIIALAKYSQRAGLQQEHVVCTLSEATSPLVLLLAKQAHVPVIRAPREDQRNELLAQADVVIVHFWNSPALYAFLRTPMPAVRVAIWLMVYGSHAPQVVPADVANYADVLVATTPGTLDLPDFAAHAHAMPVIYGIADFQRLDGAAPQPHPDFTVGYIGAISPGKIHPAFVPMSAAVNVPTVRFVVCGADSRKILEPQAHALGAAPRFDFRGYAEDIGRVLQECDVFGYPLAADTYATSEKALQEAMWFGLPPVVFAHGGVRFLVQDGVTGLMVQTEAEYTQAVERLYHAPEERAELAANAREYARATFAPQHAVAQFAALYDLLLQQPKRRREPRQDGTTPAAWFASSLGVHGADFARSLRQPSPSADARISAASDLLFQGEGGIVHYRNTYPDDRHLRYWTGLVLRARGQREAAEKEFSAAGMTPQGE